MTLIKDQLKAEAGYKEFLSTHEIPSTCTLGGWFQTNNDFDKIIGLVYALKDQYSTTAHSFVIDNEMRNNDTVRRVRLAQYYE